MADSLNLNVTALNDDIFHGWMSPPKTRGTSQILYSCLLTISACIYTSIHLNIPDPHEKRRWQTIRKIKWAVIGIFAPELVLYVAWTQYRQASQFITALCEADPDLFYMEPNWTRKCWAKVCSWSVQLHLRKEAVQSSSSGSAADETGRMLELPIHEKDARLRVDLSHGFYAVMGGIRVDTSDLDDEQTSMALSTQKLMEILNSAFETRHEFLKSLTVNLKTIKDRSKANSITKILICCQVLGTALQCIARKAHGLPLTLLEYHTFAHVVCAIGIYGVWFEKPLDVNESTIVHLPDQLKIGLAKALVLYRPKYWYYEIPHICGAANTLITVSERSIRPIDPQNPKSEFLKQLGMYATDASRTKLKAYNEAHRDKRKAYSRLDTSLWEQQVTHVGQNKLIIRFHARSRKSIRCSCAGPSKYHLILMDFTKKDQNRWNALTSEEFRTQNPAQVDRSDNLYQSRRPNYFTLLQQWSFSRAEFWPDDERGNHPDYVGYQSIVEHGSKSTIAAIIAATCITGLYGGVHAFAWHTHFPSIFETWIWRCSSVISVAFFPLLVGMVWATDTADDIGDDWESRHVNFILSALIFLLFHFLFFMVFAVLFANFLARSFLVVETFASLRSVPIGVYTTVPWTQYLPHL